MGEGNKCNPRNFPRKCFPAESWTPVRGRAAKEAQFPQGLALVEKEQSTCTRNPAHLLQVVLT